MNYSKNVFSTTLSITFMLCFAMNIALAASISKLTEKDLLKQPDKWQTMPEITKKSTAFIRKINSSSKLAVKAECDGGKEDWLRISLPMKEYEDWRKYDKLREPISKVLALAC
jgi:hypothetical protein